MVFVGNFFNACIWKQTDLLAPVSCTRKYDSHYNSSILLCVSNTKIYNFIFIIVHLTDTEEFPL